MENFLLSSLVFLIILTAGINLLSLTVNAIPDDGGDTLSAFDLLKKYRTTMMLKKCLAWSTGLVLVLNLLTFL